MSKIIILVFLGLFTNQLTNAQYLDTVKLKHDLLFSNLDKSDSSEVFFTTRKTNKFIILSETAVGIATGSIFILGTSALSAVIFNFDKNHKDAFSVLPAAFLGYILGTSTGIYYVAHNENKNTSWGYTVLSGFAGAAGGFAVSRVLPKNNLLPVLVMPFLFEILYVNLLVPEFKGERICQGSYEGFQYSYTKKIYNPFEAKKIFQMNLITVNF